MSFSSFSLRSFRIGVKHRLSVIPDRRDREESNPLAADESAENHKAIATLRSLRVCLTEATITCPRPATISTQ